MAFGQRSIEFFEITPDILARAAVVVEEFGFIAMYPAGSGYKYSCRFRFSYPETRDWLFKHFGGYKNDQVVEGGEVVYWLNLQQGRCLKFFAEIFTHLSGKQEQVKLVWKMVDLVRSNKKRRLTEQVLAEREALVDELKRVKMKAKEPFKP